MDEPSQLERLLARVLGALREVVVVGRLETGGCRIVLWNEAAERLLGYSADEALGRDVELIIPTALREGYRQGLDRLRRTGGGKVLESRGPLELPALHQEGHEVPVSLTLSVLEGPGEPGQLIMGVIRDLRPRELAERRRLELETADARRQASEAANRRLRLLVAAGAALSASLDYQSTLESLARLAAPELADWCLIDMVEEGQVRRVAIYHQDAEKLARIRQVRDRYPPDPNRPRLQVLQTGQAVLHPEIRDELLQAEARSPEHLEELRSMGLVSGMVVPLVARGRILGAITLLTSESGRRYDEADLALAQELAGRAALAVDNARLYREAREAIRARDAFLSAAAHDLKTPITSLRGFAELLLRHGTAEELDSGSLRRALQVVDQQSDKLARLVSELLDISRLQTGPLALRREWTDLARLVGEVADTARSRSDRHELSVRVTEPVRAWVDRVRLERALLGLVESAMKHNPEGGAIEIGLERQAPDEVRIWVLDYGQTVSPERREAIFREASQPGDRLGTAMGLSAEASRRIVLLHGGEMELEVVQGGGVRMVVRLPLGGEPAEAGDGR